jgi:anti-sigma B factor antagonist
MENSGDTLRISDIKELGAANFNAFRDWVRSNYEQSHRDIEIDLSETKFIDSCGLGALIALHKTVCTRKGMLRLVNPQQPVRQMLELTQMHRIFDVAQAA